ncbi:hypothetical protein HK098_005621 [Nowakowskiella sp. JEL0407]|nr:hypothetical protein HK098_005621 [Nowakowskiella sp. JEL0407]
METITGGVKPCCLGGFIEKGTPAGSEIKLGTFNCYVARANESGKPTENAVLLITDVFGWKLPNARFVADTYASEGLDCYIPDLHDEDSISPQVAEILTETPTTYYARFQSILSIISLIPQMIAWMPRHNVKATLPLLDAVLKELRETIGIKKLAAVGFCWGGKYSVLLGGGENPKVEAVGAIHPSMIDYPKEVQELKVPTTFHVSESDPFFKPSQVPEIEKILSERVSKSEVKMYPGTSHGFSLRGNMAEPNVKKARDDCHSSTIEFFKSGTPTGTEMKLGPIDCYVARAHHSGVSTESAVLLLSDVFGRSLDQKTNIILRKIAALLLKVSLIPKAVAWYPAHEVNPTFVNLDIVLKELWENFGVKKSAVVGFCWGGRLAPKVEVVAAINPSRIKYPKEIQDLMVPSAFHLSEHDLKFKPTQVPEIKKMFKEKVNDSEVTFYPGTSRGSALRGNLD